MLSYLLATDIYTPSMPEIERYFHASSNDVQKTMSYFLLGAVISCAFTGLLADQVGKKKFMLGGMALAGFASVLTIFCPTLEWLILGRFLQGMGGIVGAVIGYSIIQELYDEDKRTKIYGLLGVATAGIPAIAPFMGGVISTYFGWHFLFVIILILFTISFVCIWIVMPSSLNKKSSTSALDIAKSYKNILTSRAFLTLALLSPLFNSVEWFYLTFLPFYMQDQMGLSAELYGLIVGFLIIWFAVGSYAGSKLITLYGAHKTIMMALYMGLIGSAFLWVSTFYFPLSIWGICLPLSIFLTAFGMLFPSSVGSALNIFKDARTRSSSIRILFITSFAYFGSFSAELVDDTNLSSLAWYVSICCVVSILVYSLRKTEA
jgi:MFS transporter, DHA1 family, multidrug resistance protein